MSDLHLEFGNLDVPKTDDDKNTILVLAGDIGIASKKYTYEDFFEDMSAQFKEVIYIMGNHEHYHGKFPTSLYKLEEALARFPNVHVLEKETYIIDGVAFICASLWTSMDNCNPVLMEQARLGMNDYDLIRTGPLNEPWKRKLKPIDTTADHLAAVDFIFKAISDQKINGHKIVVITHQAPSWQSVAEEFKGEPLNGAYVSNLDDHIYVSAPELWIHGHTHVSFDYMIGDTRVLCNPRGYWSMSENDLNRNFNVHLDVEI